jgi:hypothetical protein
VTFKFGIYIVGDITGSSVLKLNSGRLSRARLEGRGPGEAPTRSQRGILPAAEPQATVLSGSVARHWYSDSGWLAGVGHSAPLAAATGSEDPLKTHTARDSDSVTVLGPGRPPEPVALGCADHGPA